MAGHSQFKNIMYRKGAQDAKRAKIFAKLAREITVAAKTGLSDPKQNPRLRNAIINARSENMPNDKIKKALLKASSQDSSNNYLEMRYEGFGNKGIAIIIETLTDNKNRTASNIRTIFQKNGGSLGTQGSASHNFKQLGVIKIDKSEISDDKIFELSIEAGANECYSSEYFHEIQCEMSKVYNVKKKLELSIQNFIFAGIEWKPLNSVEIRKDKFESTTEFLETLEDNDDVQSVYTNLKFVNN